MKTSKPVTAQEVRTIVREAVEELAGVTQRGFKAMEKHTEQQLEQRLTETKEEVISAFEGRLGETKKEIKEEMTAVFEVRLKETSAEMKHHFDAAVEKKVGLR